MRNDDVSNKNSVEGAHVSIGRDAYENIIEEENSENLDIINAQNNSYDVGVTASPIFSHYHNSRISGESLKNVIIDYIRHYASGRNHTSKAKRYDLQHFISFLAGGRPLNEVPVSAWTFQSTTAFIDSRLVLGELPATVARRVATIKHFGRTLAESVVGFLNPARDVKTPRAEAQKPKGLSDEELRSLSYAFEHLLSTDHGGDKFLVRRNIFLLKLLLATGLRADEARLLRVEQITEDYKFFLHVKTKGRRYRDIYLDSVIRVELQNYLVEREGFLNKYIKYYRSLTDNEKSKFPLFVSWRMANIHDPMSVGISAKTLWRVISDFGKLTNELADTDKRVSRIHPHKLRHTFAHEVLDSTKDIRLVAQVLGHSNVSVTMLYTERTQEDIAKAIEKKVQDVAKSTMQKP